MPSLLFIVFAVELVVRAVNTLGAATLNNLVRPVLCIHISLSTEDPRSTADLIL